MVKLELSNQEVEALMAAILVFVGRAPRAKVTIDLLRDVADRLAIGAEEEAERRRKGHGAKGGPA